LSPFEASLLTFLRQLTAIGFAGQKLKVGKPLESSLAKIETFQNQPV
jgi:hypothetical protein